MANGDRTRRKQDDKQPGLFDHIVAADLEGIDPPSMDSVPELQMREPVAPQPGQTLAAWGDEDPSLTAPRAVETIDAWESVEPKPEVIDQTEVAPTTEDAAASEVVASNEPTAPSEVDAPAEHTAPSEVDALIEHAAPMDDAAPALLVLNSTTSHDDAAAAMLDASATPTDVEVSAASVHVEQGDAIVRTANGAADGAEALIADLDDEPAIALVLEPVTEVVTESVQPGERDDAEVVEVAASPAPIDSTSDAHRTEVIDAAPSTAFSGTVSSPQAPVFRRVEPSDTSGRAPVIALHGMPSRRSELASDAPVASEQPGRAIAAEPAPVATPLPRHGIWAWLELTRISNVLTVATNAIVGLWVAHLLAGQATIERFIDWMPRHVGVVAGLCLLYLFGMVLNDLLDRDVDAHERPARPLPSGRVAMRPAILLAATLVATGVWLVGGGSFPVPGLAAIAIGLAFGSFAKGQRNAIQWLGEAWAVVGVGAILWNWLDHWRHADLRTPWGFEAVLLLVATIVAYSLLHRTWRGSVVLMGLCRALAYWCATLSVMSVSGMQYNGSSVSAWGLVLFPGLIAFASTIAVSLLARDEAAPTDDAAVVAPQPTRVWVRVLLVAAMLVPWAFSPVVAGGARGMLQVMTIVALPMALFCGGIFLVKSLHAERAMRSHPTRIAGGVAAWIAAFCLLDASTLSVLGAPGLSVVALGCWWITRTAQRRVAGS